VGRQRFRHALRTGGDGKARVAVEREHTDECAAVHQWRTHAHVLARRNTQRREIERRVRVHDALTIGRDPSAQPHAHADREPPQRRSETSHGMRDDEHVVIIGDVDGAGGAGRVASQQRRRQRNQVDRGPAVGREPGEARQCDLVRFFGSRRRRIDWRLLRRWRTGVCAFRGARSSSGRRLQLPVHSQERVHDIGVVDRATVSHENLDRSLLAQSAAVRAIGGERVEAVDDRQNTGAHGDVGALESPRVPAAVPRLMMALDDRHDRVGTVDRREDIRADVDVTVGDRRLKTNAAPGSAALEVLA